MDKDTFLIMALAFMCLIGCKQKGISQSYDLGVAPSEQEESVRTEDSERLADWFPEKDSVNHSFVLVAERLWMLGRENDNTNIYDYDYQMQWQQRCEESLMHCFDSIHPNSKLSRYEKADSMVNVITRFFAEDADDSTMGMIINFDLENSFLMYKIVAMSKEILKYEKSFDKEIRKWNVLHQRMDDFCCGIVNLDWFGGSGVGPVSLATRNAICNDRIVDLQKIIDYYTDDTVPSSWSVESAMLHFQKALEEMAGKIHSSKETDMFDDKERQDAYDSIYHKVLNTRPLLMKAAKEWIETRKGVLTPKSDSQHESSGSVTSEMLERMAKTIEESLSEE